MHDVTTTVHNDVMAKYVSGQRVGLLFIPALSLLLVLSLLGFARARAANRLPRVTRPAVIQPGRYHPHLDSRLAERDRMRQAARLAQLRLQKAQEEAQRQEAIRQMHENFQLHAVGAQLYTAWNTPITLKAANWDGFEYAPFAPEGLDHQPLDVILQKVHSLGFNALRLLFSNEGVETNPVVTQELDANPQLKGLRSLDIMERIIQRAHHFGLRVILCNSRSEAGRGPETQTGLWYTSRYPESAWEADWVMLVTRFRTLSGFVGADLRNEPHMTGNNWDLNAYVNVGPLWGAYQGVYHHDRDWHYVAQTLGNRLLAVDPHLLIIVEGVQMYFDPYRQKLLGGLWGSNLAGVQYDPVVLDRPGQLVYSVHEYGPQMWRGQWFNQWTTSASLERRWTLNWGYLLNAPTSMRAPIFVGEFGTCSNFWSCLHGHDPYKQGLWFTSFVQYMHAHPEVGWAYWSLNPKGPFWKTEDNFYSLFYPDWKTVHQPLVGGLAPLLSEPNG